MASEQISFQVEDLLDNSDFTVDAQEAAKGRAAVQDYLASIKGSDLRVHAEENLHALAVLISGGECSATDFPWHQVRSHHRVAAMSMLREDGIPARIETWRCTLDEGRKFHQVPQRFSTGQVQKMASSLHRVIDECHNLGFLTEEERDQVIKLPNSANGGAKARFISDSEFRGLASACNTDTRAAGCRDALILYLGFQCGLRVGETVALGLKDLHFDNRRGQVTVRVREAGKSRARVVPLSNEACIALEDWMELRGDNEGSLLCPLARGRLDIRRMTVAQVKEICDQRAKEAAVTPFSPHDLRRNWELRLQAKKRKSVAKSVDQIGSSLLFSDEEEEEELDEESASKIQFPFAGRSTLG